MPACMGPYAHTKPKGLKRDLKHPVSGNVAKLSDKFIKCFLTPGGLLELDPISGAGGNRNLYMGSWFLKGFRKGFKYGYKEGRETCGELESGKIK